LAISFHQQHEQSIGPPGPNLSTGSHQLAQSVYNIPSKQKDPVHLIVVYSFSII